MQSIYIMEYSSIIKMNAVLVHIITWTNNENMLSERSQFMQIHMLYNFIHMKMQNREIKKK